MLWRVQTAWSQGLHPAFMGREQHLAERDVSRLLGTWIIKNLLQLSAHYTQTGHHPDFALQANMVASGIGRLLDAGDVWGAYDLFHSFLDKFENEFDFPTWAAAGTVIVEAPPGLGPVTRKKFLNQEDFEQIPPGTPTLGGLGAIRRWKIWWGDFGGRRHPSVFLKEDEAMAYLKTLLEAQIEKLHSHASTEAMVQASPERVQYAEEAIGLVFELRHMLEAGNVQEAYERYLEFESVWNDAFPPISLQDAIGTVRAEVA